MRLAALCLLASAVLPSVSQAQAPVFVITPETSTITFFVKASIALQGNFEKWDATLTFSSPDVSTGYIGLRADRDHLNALERYGTLIGAGRNSSPTGSSAASSA